MTQKLSNEMNAWSAEEFKQELLSLGRYYHIHHPYNIAMNSGEYDKKTIQKWVANRFYYQINIPRKDAAIIANCDSREVRREWLRRIVDHDGRQGEEGGIEAWVRLGIACGLTREQMNSRDMVLPGVRFAVDAYVRFAKEMPWQDAVCSSLTELFAPNIHQERLSQWPKHYPWIDQDGLQYFRNRLKEVPLDVDFALEQTLMNFTTEYEQRRALSILKFKLDVLWAISDALHYDYMMNHDHDDY